jgi:hypothetical protein
MFGDALFTRELFPTLTTAVFVRDHSVSPELSLHQVVSPRVLFERAARGTAIYFTTVTTVLNP